MTSVVINVLYHVYSSLCWETIPGLIQVPAKDRREGELATMQAPLAVSTSMAGWGRLSYQMRMATAASGVGHVPRPRNDMCLAAWLRQLLVEKEPVHQLDDLCRLAAKH